MELGTCAGFHSFSLNAHPGCHAQGRRLGRPTLACFCYHATLGRMGLAQVPWPLCHLSERLEAAACTRRKRGVTLFLEMTSVSSGLRVGPGVSLPSTLVLDSNRATASWLSCRSLRGLGFLTSKKESHTYSAW